MYSLTMIIISFFLHVFRSACLCYCKGYMGVIHHTVSYRYRNTLV